MPHTCFVCGYPALQEPTRSTSGGASYEICPSCGFQFGVSDDDRGVTPEQWRAAWEKRGAKWSSAGIASPAGWNAKSQLASLNASGEKSGSMKSKSPAARTTRRR